jgi:glycosyltransferase involved in cell wall biosynthesis
LRIQHEKVLLIGLQNLSHFTGIGQSFEMLVAGFSERKIPFTVVFLESRNNKEKIGTFSLAHSIKILSSIFLIWKKLFTVKKIYLTISLSRYGFIRDMLIIWPARLFHRRITLHVKSGGYFDFYSKQPSFLRRIISKTLAQSSRIIILGELLRKQFDFSVELAPLIHVVPNGLTLGLTTSVTEKNLISKTPINILYLSNLILSKGYLDVLEACNILVHKRNIPVRCYFCGDFISIEADGKNDEDWNQEKFTQRIKNLGLVNDVEYVGQVAGEQKNALLENAHVMVLPTAYPWEGQPVSIIDALAFATPIIATNFRAIPEEVIHDFNGLFVRFNCPEEIADAIERMWRDPDFYAYLSRNAYHHYRQNFTQEEHLRRLIQQIIGETN